MSVQSVVRRLYSALASGANSAISAADQWSFSLLAQGARTRQQLRDAAAAAEDVRRQVLDALEQARAT